tara:strand:- start:4252 stop:4788 length:537 start_codon:yes stop_codon:yes gene_type:complete
MHFNLSLLILLLKNHDSQAPDSSIYSSFAVMKYILAASVLAVLISLTPTHATDPDSTPLSHANINTAHKSKWCHVVAQLWEETPPPDDSDLRRHIWCQPTFYDGRGRIKDLTCAAPVFLAFLRKRLTLPTGTDMVRAPRSPARDASTNPSASTWSMCKRTADPEATRTGSACKWLRSY